MAVYTIAPFLGPAAGPLITGYVYLYLQEYSCLNIHSQLHLSGLSDTLRLP